MKTYEQKLAEAKKWMGRLYLLHPANHVKRLRKPMPDGSRVLKNKKSGGRK